MDLFINLTIETEQEMDFEDEGMADLTAYEEGYEWTEENYLRLRFKAIRHVASQGYFNDVYAYLLRTRPDELHNHVQLFNENQEQWRDRTNRLNSLQVQVEAILEQQARAPKRGYAIPPPEDVLVPPSRPTMASEMRSPERERVKPPPHGPYGTTEGRHRETNRGGSKASSFPQTRMFKKEIGMQL